MRVYFPFSPWWNTNYVAQSDRQVAHSHFLWKPCSPAREEKTRQWAPHKHQAVHVQDLGSVQLLWTDSHLHFPRSVYWCPGYFPFLEGQPSGLETRTSFDQSYFHSVVTVTQEDDNTFMLWILGYQRREQSEGECVQISKKIALFRQNPLQRTKLWPESDLSRTEKNKRSGKPEQGRT